MKIFVPKLIASRLDLALVLTALFIVIIFLLPFTAVLRYGFPIVLLGDTSLSALLKDVISITFIWVGFIFFAKSYRRLDAYEIVLVVYIFYGLFRTFVSFAGVSNGVASFRYEYLYVLLMLVYYHMVINGIIDHLKIINAVKYVFLVQLAIVTAVGYYEIVNKDVRFLIYGERALYLNTGFPGVPEVRSVSLLENPINLGVYLCLAVAYVGNVFSRPRLRFFSIVVWLVCLPIVVMTLSRISVVLYFLLLLVYTYGFFSRAGLIGRILVGISLSFSMIFIVTSADFSGFNLDLDVIQRRIDDSVINQTLLDDPRFSNWSMAFNAMGDLPFISHAWGLGLGVSNPGEVRPGQFRVENAFVSVFIQTGFFGLIMFLFFYVAAFFAVWRLRAPGYKFAELNMCFGYSVVVIFLSGLANDMQRNVPFSFYTWFFLISSFLLYRTNFVRGQGVD